MVAAEENTPLSKNCAKIVKSGIFMRYQAMAALLLMIAAIPCTLALLLAAARLTMASGMSTALIFVMDELDDLVFSAFLLWGGAAACRYAASVLQEKARLRARSADPAAPPAAEELRPPV